MNGLTRSDILSIIDITPKLITVPEDIVGWGGTILYIRPLTRGQQDEYQRRQFGDMKMKQTPNRVAAQTQQELVSINLYGHDTWVFIRGVCDETGKPIFTDKDTDALKDKSGRAVGWVAQQILEYSGMNRDMAENASVEEELKNSLETKD